MARKKSLTDAVNIPLVQKPDKKIIKRKNRSYSKNGMAFKIILSLVLGFAGGLAAGRLIRFL